MGPKIYTKSIFYWNGGSFIRTFQRSKNQNGWILSFSLKIQLSQTSGPSNWVSKSFRFPACQITKFVLGLRKASPDWKQLLQAEHNLTPSGLPRTKKKKLRIARLQSVEIELIKVVPRFGKKRVDPLTRPDPFGWWDRESPPKIPPANPRKISLFDWQKMISTQQIASNNTIRGMKECQHIYVQFIYVQYMLYMYTYHLYIYIIFTNDMKIYI